MKKFDIIIQNGHVYSQGRFHQTDLGILNGKIEELGDLNSASCEKTIEAKGLHIFPGVIDTQVHFREPGNEHKEDLATGTKSGLRGGVTGVFEMPNTKPPTTTLELLKDKLSRAKERCWTDYAFYLGATPDNSGTLREIENHEGVCGIKIFMGSSTGNLLVPDDMSLEKILRNGKKRCAIHAEDEDRLKERKYLTDSHDVHIHPTWRDEETALKATKRIVSLAKKTFRPTHILHVSTGQEINFLKNHKDLITVETTPNHLTLFAPDCYDRLGTLAQMNPPIRSKEHMEQIWKGVLDGVVDVIGTDHAPHTLEEKKKTYPESPSGMPGVQTLLPLMLNHVHNGRLSLIRLVELLCVNPCKIWGIPNRGNILPGMEATLTIVDTGTQRTIEHDWLLSKCGWSPYEGMEVTGWPIGVLLRGEFAMWEDEIIDHPKGKPLKFLS